MHTPRLTFQFLTQDINSKVNFTTLVHFHLSSIRLYQHKSLPWHVTILLDFECLNSQVLGRLITLTRNLTLLSVKELNRLVVRLVFHAITFYIYCPYSVSCTSYGPLCVFILGSFISKLLLVKIWQPFSPLLPWLVQYLLLGHIGGIRILMHGSFLVSTY